MFAKTSSSSSKIAFFVLALMMVLIPSYSAFAQGAGSISIEKDVLLEFPIQGAEDLPDAVTFSLYDSEDAVTPLATQAFPRGEYTLDFDFNKSDGLSSGTIARFKVNFTNKLNLGEAADTAKQPKEIWAEFSVGDSVMGSRSRVPDDAMVQLLLASDASIATYLTLAYEGDDNPIATIYRDLPLDSSSCGADLSAYFSALPAAALSAADATRATGWVDGSGFVYTSGLVGIGMTTTPVRELQVANVAPGRGVAVTGSAPSFMLSNADTEPNTNTQGIFMGLATADGNYSLSSGDGLFGLQGTQRGNLYFDSNYANTQLPKTVQTNVLIQPHTGNVGIGPMTSSPAYLLTVNGSIGCTGLTVASNLWADFVFQDNYRLPPLLEVEEYILTNKHLPGIPTEAEVKEKGIDVGKISANLLQKIEELTLYVIDLKKENDSLKSQLNGIEKRLATQPN